ncbi:MAG TPA: hypothetical protein VLS94_08845 [Fusibacter sp.]|nr:hypothetical protein [Fusibacter sp.]
MELRKFTEMKKFSGIDVIEGGFRVVFDGKSYELTEDESDGYRSYLNDVVETENKVDNTFQEIEVYCIHKDDGYYDVVEVFDSSNNQLILTFGTQNCDDYYPYCILDWKPQNMNINN